MKRYIRSAIQFHKHLNGYKSETGYIIDIIRTGYGFNNYIIRDPEGNKVDSTTSLEDAKQIIRDIANEH